MVQFILRRDDVWTRLGCGHLVPGLLLVVAGEAGVAGKPLPEFPESLSKLKAEAPTIGRLLQATSTAYPRAFSIYSTRVDAVKERVLLEQSRNPARFWPQTRDIHQPIFKWRQEYPNPKGCHANATEYIFAKRGISEMH
jgi:hypothetical protein